MEECNKAKYIVYCHTNKINNKKYIGQTCRSLEIRSGKNGRYYKNCIAFYNAIKKYGWNNFEHEVLFENLTKEAADRIEKILIQTFKTQDHQYGYNIQNGGTLKNRTPDKDLTGCMFGKLTVIGRDYSKKNGVYWLCQCNCGNPELKSVITHSLNSGLTLSCGCYNREQIKNRSQTHGMSKHPLFHIWSKTKELCDDINNDYYKNGIKFYPAWKDNFLNFYNWAIDNGYEKNLCFVRKDKLKNFYPDNCEWITKKELSKRRKNIRMITYNGETKTITEWAEQLSVNVDTLRYRLDKTNMSIDEAFTKPFKKRHYYAYNGEVHTISEWSKIYNIKLRTLRSRLLDKGKSIEEALNM